MGTILNLIILARDGSLWAPKLLFSGLLNGIGGVERKINGVWNAGRKSGHKGLAYNLD